MSTPTPARLPLRGLARTFFEAAAGGELALPHCRDCGSLSWPPREHCVRCESTAIDWVRSAGRGRVHTFTVVRPATEAALEARVPYVVAMIDLDEGPRLMSRVVDCDVAGVRIGMRVAVVFGDLGDGLVVPLFRPETAR